MEAVFGTNTGLDPIGIQHEAIKEPCVESKSQCWKLFASIRVNFASRLTESRNKPGLTPAPLSLQVSHLLRTSNNKPTRFHHVCNQHEKGHAIVKESPLHGLGLFATEDLDAGCQISALDRPLVGILTKARLEDSCANCFSSTVAPIYGVLPAPLKDTFICAKCKQVRYCGKVWLKSLL